MRSPSVARRARAPASAAARASRRKIEPVYSSCPSAHGASGDSSRRPEVGDDRSFAAGRRGVRQHVHHRLEDRVALLELLELVGVELGLVGGELEHRQHALVPDSSGDRRRANSAGGVERAQLERAERDRDPSGVSARSPSCAERGDHLGARAFERRPSRRWTAAPPARARERRRPRARGGGVEGERRRARALAALRGRDRERRTSSSPVGSAGRNRQRAPAHQRHRVRRGHADADGACRRRRRRSPQIEWPSRAAQLARRSSAPGAPTQPRCGLPSTKPCTSACGAWWFTCTKAARPPLDSSPTSSRIFAGQAARAVEDLELRQASPRRAARRAARRRRSAPPACGSRRRCAAPRA